MRKLSFALLAILGTVSFSVQADPASAQKLADRYAAIAANVDSGFQGLSAEDGKAFFNREIIVEGKPVACASCHTANPADVGKNFVTGKAIKPLAPSANAKRFADIDKVEKNFEKHCLDVIGRDCTAVEKGNFVTYLLTVK